jgi:hypothetical protein
MSEYCSKCSPFENDYDIDLAEIALKLDDERSVNIFCEGYCKIRAIYKDEKGNLYFLSVQMRKKELSKSSVCQWYLRQ